jgi:hypothetical protein
MRRRPPAGTPALAERAAAADRFMGPARRRLERAMRRAYREGGEVRRGWGNTKTATNRPP